MAPDAPGTLTRYAVVIEKADGNIEGLQADGLVAPEPARIAESVET